MTIQPQATDRGNELLTTWNNLQLGHLRGTVTLAELEGWRNTRSVEELLLISVAKEQRDAVNNLWAIANTMRPKVAQ